VLSRLPNRNHFLPAEVSGAAKAGELARTPRPRGTVTRLAQTEIALFLTPDGGPKFTYRFNIGGF
jgi:hypothetical protein